MYLGTTRSQPDWNKRKYNPQGQYHLANMLNSREATRIDSVIEDGILAVAMCSYVNTALAKATWAKYGSGWRAFCQFEEHFQLSSTWPLSCETLRDFALFCLVYKKLKPDSVRTYLSALSMVHTLKGFKNCHNFKDKLLDMILTGADNAQLSIPGKVTTRRVVTMPLLRLIGHRIAGSSWSEGSKRVVWTAVLTGFFSSARLGEILAKAEGSFDPTSDLLWGQVQIRQGQAGNSALLHIRIPKSANEGGRFLDLFPFPKEGYCPVTALEEYKKFQGSLGMVEPGQPVFRFASGKNLTPAKLNQILQDLLKDIYEPGKNSISCHSLRAGIPSALSKFPDLVSDEEIKGMGGWHSDAVDRYTRLPEAKRRATFQKAIFALSALP